MGTLSLTWKPGIDMIAHYCLKNFGHEFVNTMSLEMLELNPGGRAGQFYT
jgi:hypothetical protein